MNLRLSDYLNETNYYVLKTIEEISIEFRQKPKKLGLLSKKKNKYFKKILGALQKKLIR
jgi:hypothetical protein